MQKLCISYTKAINKRFERVGRPDMPGGYGLTPVNGQQDLVAWEHVEERLRASRNYWISSTRPDGQPHAMPVWGIWLDGAFYFSTDPHSRKGRNLAANPRVVMHLESGDDVVILEGQVVEVTDSAIQELADGVYHAKYDFHMIGPQAAPGLVYQLRPVVAFAWPESSFSTQATRWTFEI
jgi:PPOX class probable F420-dependent enzyme